MPGSSPAPQLKNINSLVLCLLYGPNGLLIIMNIIMSLPCSDSSNVFPSHLALNAQYPCIMSAMQRSLPLTSSPRPPHPAPCSLSSSHSGLLMFLTYSQFAFNSASSRTLLLLPGVLPRDSACLPASLHSLEAQRKKLGCGVMWRWYVEGRWYVEHSLINTCLVTSSKDLH